MYLRCASVVAVAVAAYICIVQANGQEKKTRSAGKTHVIEMHNNVFRPDRLEIEVGDTVVWVNKQSRRHTATRTTEPMTFDSGLLSLNETFTYSFTEVSPENGFRYVCLPHADEMIGRIVVRKRGVMALNPATSTCSPFDDPDAFAWKIFTEINHPADKSDGRGVPDKSKKIGDDGTVVWETWRMSPGEVYLERGQDPGPWDSRFSRSNHLLSADLRPAQKADMFRRSKHAAMAVPADFGQSAMNKETYEFIRQNELYTIEGQEVFHTNDRIVNFPTAAKEIKSAWSLLSTKPIDELSEEEVKAFKEEVHTSQVLHDGKTYLYGLKGLHIITKDVPNWVWTSFEHKTNPRPELADNDRHGLPDALKDTKWANYRLRGTQLEFTDSAGQSTVLANTQMEGGFQQSSSCITCHALATIGKREDGSTRANRLPFFDVRRILHRRQSGDLSDQEILYGDLGVPDAKLFQLKSGKRLYTQLDFVWSLRFAQSKEED